jgi:hypothetical protein
MGKSKLQAARDRRNKQDVAKYGNSSSDSMSKFYKGLGLEVKSTESNKNSSSNSKNYVQKLENWKAKGSSRRPKVVPTQGHSIATAVAAAPVALGVRDGGGANADGVDGDGDGAGINDTIPQALRFECAEVMSMAGINDSMMNFVIRRLKSFVGKHTVNGAMEIKGILPSRKVAKMDYRLSQSKWKMGYDTRKKLIIYLRCSSDS